MTIETPNPDTQRRAEELAETVLGYCYEPDAATNRLREIAELIAPALTETENRARNAALEEAAKVCDDFCGFTHTIKLDELKVTDPMEFLRDGAEDIQEQIRALITPPTSCPKCGSGVFYGGHCIKCFADEHIIDKPANKVPDGWILVPVEPTDKMLTAGRKAYFEGRGMGGNCDVAQRQDYKAMIAARPTPIQPTAQVKE